MDQKYYNISYAESPFGTLNQYMTRTYGWMAAGLLVTFATALLTVTTPLFELMFSTGLVFLLSIVELVLVAVLSARVEHLQPTTATGLFFAYAVLNGINLSTYFIIYDLSTLILAFLVAGLDLEQVGRNMGAAARLQQSKGFIKLRDGIIGQRQHNIPADLPEACLPRPGKCLRGGSSGVGAAQAAQLGIVSTLHPKADAGYPGGCKTSQAFRRDNIGVGFQRDLRTRQRGGGFDQLAHLVRPQQGRGAAAKI